MSSSVDTQGRTGKGVHRCDHDSDAARGERRETAQDVRGRSSPHHGHQRSGRIGGSPVTARHLSGPTLVLVGCRVGKSADLGVENNERVEQVIVRDRRRRVFDGRTPALTETGEAVPGEGSRGAYRRRRVGVAQVVERVRHRRRAEPALDEPHEGRIVVRPDAVNERPREWTAMDVPLHGVDDARVVAVHESRQDGEQLAPELGCCLLGDPHPLGDRPARHVGAVLSGEAMVIHPRLDGALVVEHAEQAPIGRRHRLAGTGHSVVAEHLGDQGDGGCRQDGEPVERVVLVEVVADWEPDLVRIEQLPPVQLSPRHGDEGQEPLTGGVIQVIHGAVESRPTSIVGRFAQ